GCTPEYCSMWCKVKVSQNYCVKNCKCPGR
uniref:Potassium channel toxin alpha-KTx 20.1 n=1 Tax=Tityus trivittatus TaxID=369776 RepID=KA201_TITTR|nr:RecName: Full=Potassium channel toxin alpha-KTx 20.1; AltName: Full=Toxin Tt28 [Tityus trivittatus]